MVPQIFEYVSPESKIRAGGGSAAGSKNNSPQRDSDYSTARNSVRSTLTVRGSSGRESGLWQQVGRSLFEGIGIHLRADSADEELHNLDRIEELISKLRLAERIDRAGESFNIDTDRGSFLLRRNVVGNNNNNCGEDGNKGGGGGKDGGKRKKKKNTRKLSISSLNPFSKDAAATSPSTGNSSGSSNNTVPSSGPNSSFYNSGGLKKINRAMSMPTGRWGKNGITINDNEFISLGGIAGEYEIGSGGDDEDVNKRGFFRKKKKKKEVFYNEDEDYGIEFSDFSPPPPSQQQQQHPSSPSSQHRTPPQKMVSSVDSLKRAHLVPSTNSLNSRASSTEGWLGEDLEIRRSHSRLFESEVDDNYVGAEYPPDLTIDGGGGGGDDDDDDDYDFGYGEEENVNDISEADLGGGGTRNSHESFFSPAQQQQQQQQRQQQQRQQEQQQEQQQQEDLDTSFHLPTIDNYNGSRDSDLARHSSLTARDAIVRELVTATASANTTDSSNNNNSNRNNQSSKFTASMLEMYPPSAAAFLRAMTICGFGGLVFHLHTMIWWFTSAAALNVVDSAAGTNIFGCLVKATNSDVYSCIHSNIGGLSINLLIMGPQPLSPEAHVRWMWLSLQFVIAICKLPFRFHTLKRLRTLDRDTEANVGESRGELKRIIMSRSFRIHRFLGRINQVLALIGLFFYFGEVRT